MFSGNGHGLAHYEATGYPIVCKIGTVSANLEEAGAEALFFICFLYVFLICFFFFELLRVYIFVSVISCSYG
jgi:hypothetical protein